jgi:predicted nucleic acid-binding protein
VTGVVLDTNVISEPRRPSPEPRVMAWLAGQDVDCLYLAATVVGELAHGIAILPSGRRRARFEAWLLELVHERFAGRILPFDGEAALLFGQILAVARARGRTIDAGDAQIAAVARLHGMAVATRDASDFEPLGIAVINPWDAG